VEQERVYGRRYRATERIGSGGMADVYKAVDEVLGRTVAVKVMHARYASEAEFASRFRQEAQAAANLQSPNIVNMYDWGQDGDTYYIVMEYVRGTDLKTLITQRGPLDSRKVADIGAQAASALAVAHGYDVIHRDIKPHNIMVTPDGAVKVMDFGIARTGDSSMTQTGSVLGTAHYVSPEQAQGKSLTAATDLYSLGVVLYEAATGRVPFDADSPVAVALKQVHDQPVPPHMVNGDVSPTLEAVILRAMAKNPAERYASADELRRDLAAVRDGAAPSAAALAGAAIGGAAVAGAADATQVLPATGARIGETAVMPTVGGPSPRARGAAAGQPKRSNAGRIWITVAVIVALLAAGGALAWSSGLLGPRTMGVPNVVGLTQEEATVEIADADLSIGTITPEFSASVEAGRVISQSPGAGKQVEKGTPVDLVVSKGIRRLVVPNLIGSNETTAAAALRALGLDVFVAERRFDKSPEGTVLEQSIAAGEEVEEGTTVELVVSRGPEQKTVPSVVGKKRAQAEKDLKDAGFVPKVSERFDDNAPAGIVLTQNPGAGGKADSGSTVEIVVSKGPEMLTVPDVVGQTEAAASKLLTDAGFQVDVQDFPSADEGKVLEQTPKANQKAKRGTTVTILVGRSEMLP